MVATVFPSTANQNVNWSIVHGTGMSTISITGLVTGVSNGTVYAKAAAIQDSTVVDSLMITLSSQTAQPPAMITIAATDISSAAATLNGTVNANGLSTDASFEWGLTSAYGNTINAAPANISGTTVTPVLANLTGLTSNTTYHFRIKGSNAAGPATGTDLTFTTTFGVGVDVKGPLNADIYPVPNDGQFIISITNGSTSTLTLDVYNPLGSKIFSSFINTKGNDVTYIDLRPVPTGVYTVVLRGGGEELARKVLIVK
jgi:hypothetical protein